MLQILTGGSSALRFHSLHLSDGLDDGSSVLPEGESSPVLQVASSVFGAVVLPVLGLQVPDTFTQAGNTLAVAGSCSLPWVPPQKKKTKPHRSSGSRHTRRTDTRAAQRSEAQAQAQAHHTLSLGWGLLGPFYPFFPFPCLLWLFGLILFFSFLHHPILPSAKPSTLLTFLLGRSLVPSLDFVSLRFSILCFK